MLDVHPPHAPTHTWRDFFIHVGTICVGLLIAVGLQQTVEMFHRRHQREHLLEDLKHEAEVRVPRVHENFKIFMADLAWYGAFLQAGRAEQLQNGKLIFVVPPRAVTPPRIRPADSVWPSAKASGVVAVLPQDDIEVWSRIDQVGQAVLDQAHLTSVYRTELTAVTDRLGITLTPGTTLSLAPKDSEELLRTVALLRAHYSAFANLDADWAGASNAALHGVHSTEALQPYETQAQTDMRK